MRRVILLATLGVMLSVVTAGAAEKQSRSAIVSERRPASGEPIIRPPASIPRGSPRPAANSRPSATDRHVAEFLRWKDQHPPR